MDENTAAGPLARDADGKALMSLDELKEGMFQSIRESGTVELIRAQLRRRFIEKLQQQRRIRDEQDDENNASRANREATSSTPDEKLVHGLVTEYLASKGLENTLAVFVPEIGGARNQVDSATILEMLHVNSAIQSQLELERTNTGHSLLLVLVRELVRRFQLATMDSGTQTAMDCFDHRIVLENQLRRVENSYLAECAAQKLQPQKSLEERMVQYQREYDDICEKRLQEELERYKTTEVSLVRAEERKQFNREVDNLRSTLMQEYRDKQGRLQEHERDLELAFVARRTELETSLFETRQSLFKDMERLRVKEAELQVKVESDFRHFASETQRFQLWEESVRTQEANLEGIVAQALREKERAWNIERQQALGDIQSKQDELSDRERAITTETGTLKTLKAQVTALQQEVAALEAALSKSRDDLRLAQNSTLELEKNRTRLEGRVEDLEQQLSEQKSSVGDVSTVNARLMADKSLVETELIRYKQKNVEVKQEMKLLAAEVKSLQQQMLDMKLDEANAVVAERKKLLQVMDEERDRFQWKENELLVKVRDVQSRLAESEALAEKFQSQYEDEKVHVESLRHDVANLNSLLTQAQATINSKHGVSRDLVSFRAQRGAVNSDTVDPGACYSAGRGGNERTFMMKMMEMMTNFQDERSIHREDSRQAFETSGTAPVLPDRKEQFPSQAEMVRVRDEEQDEANRLKEDQARIERGLLEQREYEKKKQDRLKEQERELAEQQQQFQERLARMRQERIEEEEQLEEQRKRRQAEEEARLQHELKKQREAVQEAAQWQQTLAEQRLADEKKRLQDEQAFTERRRAQEREFNEGLEAKRRQQQVDEEVAAKQKQEREAEEGRLKEEREAQEEQERIRLENEREAALQDVRQKQEKDRQREAAARLEEEERKRQEEETAERSRIEIAVEETSWQEPSIEDHVAESSSEQVRMVTITDTAATDPNETKPIERRKQESAVESAMSASEDAAAEPTSEDTADSPNADHDVENNARTTVQELPVKTPEEEEAEQQKAAEEAKKKEDEDAIDVYRQRVLARKAAEKQRQEEQEAAEKERNAREEEERLRTRLLGDASESDQELELSGGSFAESSAASNSDSF